MTLEAEQSGPRGRVARGLHTGLQVSDMDAALAVFVDLLGMTKVRDVHSDGWLADLRRGVPGAKVRIVYVEGYGVTVELLEFEPAPDRPISHQHSAGAPHLAFSVEDLAGLHRRLADHGVEFLTPPREGPFGGNQVAFAVGPDGVLLELIELPAGS
ncbi:MAG TPA: VOC family protein [Acidimicrobiales bacterium]|nr:VOC family protein [Acidimicrobiales bacterium]